MKPINKITLIMLCVALVLSFVSCSNSNNDMNKKTADCDLDFKELYKIEERQKIEVDEIEKA